ncbi:two-component system chemotaxis response regulator CheB [Hypnocyclicus thermotrophus]|uniref:Protein-glutamate methylesterase/protein-glutamine glutaminase n=1 Tax=Hypnocyclicus thermotrophus TaxID=1627895 RepID=A0AA46E0E9_9FUSO|nr:chemotaxis-specific protein-glutamate methyltransferase CheB [Hypnocyclicus thermotrophus]TDT72515.1 two-component system chemotaxis response regulator CheB [Hypnocyclicus thermotrophus]
MKKIRVLVADDSALIRNLIKNIIKLDNRIEIIDFAKNGIEAIEKTINLKPEVVLLDINMPKMDGLTALNRIVYEKICPVIIFSSLSKRDSVITYEAFELGAFACIEKPSSGLLLNINDISKELLQIVIEAGRIGNDINKLNLLYKRVKHKLIKTQNYYDLEDITSKVVNAVTIGISTGGPKNIYEVIPYLPENLNAPVFLVQHMPPSFIDSYAERLHRYSKLKVVVAENEMEVKNGVVYVAKGDYHLKIKKNTEGKVFIKLSKIPDDLFIPSVNIMMKSVLNVFKERTIGVLMTGMGDDGADAMVKIKKNGGFTITESKETSIVFGMPNEAIKRGGSHITLPSYAIAKEIVNRINKLK